LYGDLIENVYMAQPTRFTHGNSQLVYKLNKMIYGLKQASHSWFLKFSSTLIQLGFNLTRNDSSLFAKFSSSLTLFLLIMKMTLLSLEITQLISLLS